MFQQILGVKKFEHQLLFNALQVLSTAPLEGAGTLCKSNYSDPFLQIASSFL
jgi:hypothetical protein